jgi:hypothetical protein
MEKIFSVPLNPKLTESQFYDFLEFLKNHRDLLADVYFTCRIPPFKQDAMGDIFVLEEDNINAVRAALHIQETIGIPVSATFNNITVRPDQTNLDIFIANFKPIYDAGVKIATIPHTHWMATGQIKKAFPDLYVKNTILRDVRTASEIVSLAKYGFDYINLDRDLMRDQDTLIRLKEAKTWISQNLNKQIKFSLLANEGCAGNSPMMVEHFEYNNTRSESNPQYFGDPISRVSCSKWGFTAPAISLKTADLPPWKEDWLEFINDLGIDVFKMHGREDAGRLQETMDMIRRWKSNEEILHYKFDEYIKINNLKEKPIDIWRQKIKNCKFDCWECQYCDKIYTKKSSLAYSDIITHVVESIDSSGVPTVWIDIPGLTSPRVQTLLNYVSQGVGTYLEVGSYLGATAAAVLKDNLISAYFVDNWKDNIQPRTDIGELPANNKDQFIKNISKYEGKNNITILDRDLFEVDLNFITEKIKMFFYDGPHDKETTKKAIEYYYPCLDEEFILIMDDANWDEVVSGTDEALENLNATVDLKKLLVNEIEDRTKWWNGLYIIVARKQ